MEAMLHIVVSSVEKAAGCAIRHCANLGLEEDDEIMLVQDHPAPAHRKNIGVRLVSSVSPIRKRTKLSRGRSKGSYRYTEPPCKSGLVYIRFTESAGA